MNSSPTIANLAASLVKAQADLTHVGKDKTVKIKTQKGGTISFKYADLASLIDCVRAAFHPHGLAVFQTTRAVDGCVVVDTTIMHESGEWISDGGFRIRTNDGDAKALGSAVTYARRYALAAIAGIAQTDDDGRAASKPAEPARPAEPMASDEQVAHVKARAEALPEETRDELRAWMRSKQIGAAMTEAQYALVCQSLDAAEDAAGEPVEATA